jgi:hypothetical protein
MRDVPVQDLLFALARDAKLNIDIHPAITGTVTMNVSDQTLVEILDRVARQVDLRYDINGKNLSIQPDSPYLKNYRVDYPNIARETTSSIGSSSSVGGGQHLKHQHQQCVFKPLLGHTANQPGRPAARNRQNRLRCRGRPCNCRGTECPRSTACRASRRGSGQPAPGRRLGHSRHRSRTFSNFTNFSNFSTTPGNASPEKYFPGSRIGDCQPGDRQHQCARHPEPACQGARVSRARAQFGTPSSVA